ncbi:hypothetical protein LCGC14_1932570 [marine sediment metagenome]|uniref:Uncharacterized protein n=1 Tax=marine sediment metagenome TaxID=412755 RepID=A0A0F9IK66_9ZZZZ
MPCLRHWRSGVAEKCSFPNCDKDKGGAFVIATPPSGEIRMPLCFGHLGQIGAMISRFASEGKDFMEEVFRDA